MKRYRIGLLVPSTNTAVEADYQRILPSWISTHSERLYIPDGEMSPAFLDTMNEDLPKKVELLASAHVDAVVYACTSGSFYRGEGWDRDVKDVVESVANVDCITTSLAVTDALQSVNAQNLSVSTPYPEWTNDRLTAYYTAAGFNVLAATGDKRAAAKGHRAVNDQEPAEIRDFALLNIAPGTDTLFLSCTAWRALECIQDLEAATGLRAVSSNQATLWAVLNALGLQGQIKGVGSLFEGQCSAAAIN